MPSFQFTSFATKFLEDCGIQRLMDDHGKALATPGAILMGGGNPSHIPAVQALFRDRMLRMLDSEDEFENLIGNYDGPAGAHPFRVALADFFRSEFGWEISEKNVLLTNGSQTAFFMLFNMFGGAYPDGSRKRVLLPLAPEYIGYEDVGIDKDVFLAYRPTIELIGDDMFKYHVDFDELTIDESVGAICVSRPTNPTGNVLTAEEIDELSDLAQQHNIPLIIDNAYGEPFPSIIFTDARAMWEPHIILSMSLSKLGLPNARTGILIAHEDIINCLSVMNAVQSLAPGGFGAALALDAVRTRDIIRISHDVIKPYYRNLSEQAVGALRVALAGTPYRIHVPEGAIFLWLWFPDLPISSAELYERLKERGVIVVSGHYFFPGLAAEWQHKHECIRMNYASDPENVPRGIEIIGDVVRELYAKVA